MEGLSTLSSILSTVVGLNAETKEKVMTAIKNGQGLNSVKNNIIRSKLGGRGAQALKNTIEYAKADVTTDTAEKKEEKEPGKMGAEKKDIKESSLMDFLINEVMLDIDIEDPAAAASEFRKASRKAKTNPRAANREAVKKAKEETMTASKSSGPTKSIDMQIARAKAQLATLTQRRANMTASDSE